MRLEAYIKMPSGLLWVLQSRRAKNGVWWEIPHPSANTPPSEEMLDKILAARMEIAKSVIPRGSSVLTLPASQQALSPYILSSCKSDRKTALVAYAYALGEFLGAEKTKVYKVKGEGELEHIPKQVAPAFAHMPAQHGRQGERAEIRLPNGDVLEYELWTTTVDGFWLCEEHQNFKVFDELGIEPEEYCAKYYTPRGGSWPAVSLKEYPDWRKRLLDAMVGFTEYGCAVTMYDKDDIRVHHLPRCEPATSPEDRITAVVTIGGKQYEHKLSISLEMAWWNYCDGPNFAVFDALDVNGNQHCADYYAEVESGHWPCISTDEPDWEDKLRDAMLGLAQYGAEVVVTYPDGKQYKSGKSSKAAVTWTPEEKETIKKYLNSLIQQL